jgi:cell wall-associated NlpC family hydrolase
MKNLFFVSVAFSIFSGASLSATAQRSVKFIDGIEINPEPIAYKVATSTYEAIKTPAVRTTYKIATTPSAASATEACRSIQFKYAQILDRDVESVTNTSLYNFIDEWWATRYRYGGTSKKGIDCSAFTSLLENAVYTANLPRTAREQYDACEKIDRDSLLEGDMVFFNTRGGVGHVGVYLGGGYFVHASVASGVTISNLSDDYYSRKFIGGGRPLNNIPTGTASISK